MSRRTGKEGLHTRIIADKRAKEREKMFSKASELPVGTAPIVRVDAAEIVEMYPEHTGGCECDPFGDSQVCAADCETPKVQPGAQEDFMAEHTFSGGTLTYYYVNDDGQRVERRTRAGRIVSERLMKPGESEK